MPGLRRSPSLQRLTFIALGLALAGQAAAVSLPRSETLTYQVTWNGIPAGTIQQTLERQGDGTYRLTANAETNRVVNVFYRLDSDQQSLFKVNDERLQVLRYEHVNQGKEPFPRSARFDWNDKVAHLDNEDGRKDVPINAYTYDPNTLIQQLRFFPDSIRHPFVVVDGKNSKKLQIKDLGTASISTRAGNFEAQCVQQVDLQQNDPNKKRVASVCYSNDARRLPVELRYHTKYGDIIARLSSVKSQPGE
ncbi:DUF3108 domain-containing protein [Thermithiobacillus tepidarius DSM 3134]|uniref:DUF3108 domain-containing protein n=1 Tax=Thermithiobacillus tepidarius TaxID=929 RepID=UPI000407F67E|nr:DUF3108 domain-containing protein [Thermithiobacillus tepidarius]